VADHNQPKLRKPKRIDRLIEFAVTPFYRLNIARKLMLGYSMLLLLLVGISAFALFYLNHLNKINNSLLETDLPIVNISGKMIDVILAQEWHVQRYLILRSPEVLKEFWNKEKEFNRLSDQLRALPGQEAYSINQIISLQLE
jgi:CHASE3 domain sensor protein